MILCPKKNPGFSEERTPDSDGGVVKETWFLAFYIGARTARNASCVSASMPRVAPGGVVTVEPALTAMRSSSADFSSGYAPYRAVARSISPCCSCFQCNRPPVNLRLKWLSANFDDVALESAECGKITGLNLYCWKEELIVNEPVVTRRARR